jgi:2-polyprenyl-6-methoxyphenol hydroxylase-like FAD-dependent oxidoreductase
MLAPDLAQPRRVRTTCCIAGGGPAGMMLGYLLARAGIDVAVLEKHGDFLRDFRGDTIHPSTLELMHQLGLLDNLLARPHQEARQIKGSFGGEEVPVADFTHLPTHCRFIAFMPQWDFLDFLADEARALPGFNLFLQTEATRLVWEDDRVAGVAAEAPEGAITFECELTVAADGRRSTLRGAAGLDIETLGAPIDVLWMRISRDPSDPDTPFGRFDRGQIVVLIYRGDYWQCGYVIPKDRFEAIKIEGIEAFRDRFAKAVPFLSSRVWELRDWDDIKLLTVAVDRLRRWYRPGMLCIGDAAHAMSPVGGVGINLAIQDAVAAANMLARPLRDGTLGVDDLRKVEQRRSLPTRITQAAQVFVQDRILGRVISATRPMGVPWPARLLRQFPLLRRIPAHLIGIGVRPELVDFSIFDRGQVRVVAPQPD